MKINIIAIAVDDGWAFIVKEGKIFLLSPPYTSHTEVSRKVVEHSIYLYRVEECDIVLNSIDDAVEYLKKKYIESMKKRGIKIPSSKQLRRLWKYATDDVLLKCLKKIKNELIPEGKLDIAKSMASDLIKLEKVQNNSEMREMCRDIINKCNQEK